MSQRSCFHAALVTAAVLGPGLLVLPSGAQAQGLQEATPMVLPVGACGQALGLTHIFTLPVDQIAPAAPVLDMARNEARFVEFRLSQAAALRLETRLPANADADPVLTLYDSTGSVVEYDDDGAGDLNALLDIAVDPGTYCAQVRMLRSAPHDPVPVTLDFRVNGAGGGGAQIGAGFAGDPALPCGDPARTQIAGLLSPGFGRAGFDGTVPAGGSQDWVIALNAPMSLRLEASDAKLDTVLTLRDAARSVVAENDDGPEMGTGSMIVETLTPGEYCISVAGYADTGGSARLEIFEAAASGGGAGGGAGQIDGGGSGGVAGGGTGFAASGPCGDASRTLLLGRIGRGFGSVGAGGTVPDDGTQDWILSLADPLELRLEATADGVDTVLSLHDTSGSLLDENDDGMDIGTDSRIDRSLAAGDYCLSVRGFGGGGGEVRVAAYETPAGGGVGGGQIGGGAIGGGSVEGGGVTGGAVFAAGDPCGDPAMTQDLGTLGSGFLQRFAQGNVPPDGTSHVAAVLAGPLDLTVSATSGAFDTVLSIHDATGRLIAENDDGPGTGTDSEIVTALQAGPVCFSVRGFGGSSGAFELAILEDDAASQGGAGSGAIGGVGGGDVEGGTGIAEAQGPCGDAAVTAPIGSLMPGFGSMSFALQVDSEGASNLLFDVTAAQTLRIETTDTDFDTILELYRGATLLDENDDSPEGGTDSLLTSSLTPGEYCASVRGFAGEGGSLTLIVSEPGAGGQGGGSQDAGFRMPGADSGIVMVDLGTLGAGVLELNDFTAQGESWIVFDVAAPASASVRAINMTGSFRLGLFDADTGAPMGAEDGWGGIEPAIVEAMLPAGRYAVGVAPDNAFAAGPRRIEIVAD